MKTNVTTTVESDTKVALEKQAAFTGLSLSAYVAYLITNAVIDGDPAPLIVRHCRDQHGSLAITIPPEVRDHLKLHAGQPLVISPVPGGALLRPVK